MRTLENLNLWTYFACSIRKTCTFRRSRTLFWRWQFLLSVRWVCAQDPGQDYPLTYRTRRGRGLYWGILARGRGIQTERARSLLLRPWSEKKTTKKQKITDCPMHHPWWTFLRKNGGISEVENLIIISAFTYCHPNTPIDQWEREYHLIYVIKVNTKHVLVDQTGCEKRKKKQNINDRPSRQLLLCTYPLLNENSASFSLWFDNPLHCSLKTMHYSNTATI